MDVKAIDTEIKKCETEKAELMKKTGSLTSSDKKKYETILDRIETNGRQRGNMVDISMDVNGKSVSVSDIIKHNLDKEMSKEDEEKLKAINKRIDAFKTIKGE